MSETGSSEQDIDTLKRSQKIRQDVVLIQDKEEDIMVLKVALESCGYKVVSIKNARKTTQILSSKPMRWVPEAFIVDLVLEGSSGYEVLRNIKGRFESKKVPFVVVSDLAGEDDIVEASHAGANAFVEKPFAPQDLLDAIVFCLENIRKPIQERKLGIYVKRSGQPVMNHE